MGLNSNSLSATRSAPSCPGGSCGNGSSGNLGSLHHLPGNVNSLVSVKEGKLKMLARQLKDGDHELYVYHSSINVLDPEFWGWYFNFNEHLLEDLVDKSILTKFNPWIGRMRYVYSENPGYTPYIEDFEVSLEKDEVAGTATLTYKDGTTSTYEVPSDPDPNLPTIYHLIERRDSKGKLIVRYEDWAGNAWPMKITDGEGRIITGEWWIEGDYRIVQYTDWAGRLYQYIIDEYNQLHSYTDPAGNVLEFEFESEGFAGPVAIKYNGETKVEYGDGPDATRVGTMSYPEGPTIEYFYDFEEGIIRKTLDDESTAYYEFNENGKFVSYTDFEGKTSNNTYDENGHLTSITTYKCGVGTETYTYDENGNMLTHTDELDNVTTYQYNDENNPDKVTKIIGPAPFNYETTVVYNILCKIFARKWRFLRKTCLIKI